MGLKVLLFTVAGLLSGSMMFSAWLTKLRGREIREYGDGNPGAMNAFKAGGPAIGIPALLLDFLKGAVPVGLARWALGDVGRIVVNGWWLIPVAIAPVLGHAFSPWRCFRGGKAVAVTFGVWCGLTLWEGPTLFGAGLGLGLLLVRNDGWRVLGGLVVLGVWLLLRGANLVHLAVWAGCGALLAFKYRKELGRPVRLRWGRGTSG